MHSATVEDQVVLSSVNMYSPLKVNVYIYRRRLNVEGVSPGSHKTKRHFVLTKGILNESLKKREKNLLEMAIVHPIKHRTSTRPHTGPRTPPVALRT